MTIHAKVYNKATQDQPESPLSGGVVSISAGLQPVLQCDGEPGTAVRRVRNCLEAVHPSKVTTKADDVVYIAVWNGTQWCTRCVEVGQFEVNLGTTLGTIVVEVEEGQHYKIP